jgi:hypothetical protein
MTGMHVCVLEQGTVGELGGDHWLPTSAFFWRSSTLLSNDRMSRPDIVANLKIMQMDADRVRAFDAVISMYAAPGGTFVEMDGTVCATALANVSQMLRPGGVFVLSLSQSLQRLMERTNTADRDRRNKARSALSAAVLAVQPDWSLVPPASYKTSFVSPYVQHFFRAADRSSIAETLLQNLHQNRVLLFRKTDAAEAHSTAASSSRPTQVAIPEMAAPERAGPMWKASVEGAVVARAST